MWKRIKKFYWKQKLNALEGEMMIFAITFDYYIKEKERIKAIIAELG
jgi:hypothetical protein